MAAARWRRKRCKGGGDLGNCGSNGGGAGLYWRRRRWNKGDGGRDGGEAVAAATAKVATTRKDKGSGAMAAAVARA